MVGKNLKEWVSALEVGAECTEACPSRKIVGGGRQYWMRIGPKNDGYNTAVNARFDRGGRFLSQTCQIYLPSSTSSD